MHCAIYFHVVFSCFNLTSIIERIKDELIQDDYEYQNALQKKIVITIIIIKIGLL